MLHGEWTIEDQERKQAIIVFLWTYAFISPVKIPRRRLLDHMASLCLTF